MDVVKRLLGLSNCHGERLLVGEGIKPSLSGHQVYYLGYTFAFTEQPDASEIQRAVLCLRQKKPFVFSFHDETMIGVEENDVSHVLSFLMHRVVLSCVYARNQNIVAVFYHNPRNPRREISHSGLECHLFQNKTKKQARQFAERISDELIFTCRRRRESSRVEMAPPATRAFAKYVDYENWKPASDIRVSCQNNNEICNGSTSTFSKSNATMASIDNDDSDRCSSELLESLNKIDLPRENKHDPSTVPKPDFYDLPVQVHKNSSISVSEFTTGTEVFDYHHIANDEFSCLADLAETDL